MSEGSRARRGSRITRVISGIREVNEQQVRQKVIESHNQSFFIRAGAGAGKTTLIVDKVTDIIVTKKAKRVHLAVITFTNQAAEELKSRIQNKLSQQQEKYHIDMIPDLFIGTIHSFCAEILPICHAQLGKDESIEVMTEQESKESWEEYIKIKLEKDSGLNQLREYGCCDELIKVSGELLLEFGVGIQVEGNRKQEFPNREKVWNSLEEVLASAPQGCGRDNISTGISYWHQNKQESIQTLYRFANYNKVRDLRIRSWLEPKQAKEFYQKLEEWQQNQWLAFEGRLSKSLYREVIQSVKRYIEEYQEWKKSQGKYSFQDLLTQVKELISQNQSCKESVREVYKKFIVDELQDTDKIQAEIILHLVGEKGEKKVWDKKIIGGRLCVVGDPQQSIYRFRGSDMELYHNWGKVFEKSIDGNQVKLEKNFRTQKSIGEQLNQYYHRNWEAKEAIQPPYQDLVCQQEKSKKSGIWYYPQIEGTKQEMFKFQVNWIQQEFLKKRDKEQIKTVLILAKTNQVCHEFQEELNRIMYQGKESEGLERDITQEFLYFIKTIYEQDEIQNKAYWGSEWDQKLKDRRVAELQMIKNHRIEYLWQIYCDWFYQRGIGQLSKWVSGLWAYDGQNLELIIKELEQKLSERKKQRDNGGKIRCMTVHQSKGLEADAVILLNHRQRRYQEPAYIIDYSKNRIVLSFKRLGQQIAQQKHLPGIFFPAVGEGYQELINLEKEREDAEEQRLGYVALTRAKKIILIPDIRKSRVSCWENLEGLIDQADEWKGE